MEGTACVRPGKAREQAWLVAGKGDDGLRKLGKAYLNQGHKEGVSRDIQGVAPVGPVEEDGGAQGLMVISTLFVHMFELKTRLWCL